MKTEKYETTLIRIPQQKRMWRMVGGAVLILIGLAVALIGAWGQSYRGWFSTDTAGVWYFLAAVSCVLGGIEFFKGSRTHARVLTPASELQLATDNARKAEQTAKADGVSSIVLFWITLIAGICYAYEPIVNGIKDKEVVYPIHCANPDQRLDRCPTDNIRVDPKVYYSVHVAEQFVISETEGALEPERLSNCVIADRENWSCPEPANHYTHLVMHDGKFRYDPPFSRGNGGFTSRYFYLLRKYLE